MDRIDPSDAAFVYILLAIGALVAMVKISSALAAWIRGKAR